MKKKLIILGAILLSIIILIVLFILLWNLRVKSVITLEINPSISIKLDKNDKVIAVKANNNDAKKIIKNVKDKSLSKTINNIYKNLEKNTTDKRVEMLFHSEGKLPTKELEKYLYEGKEDNFDVVLIKIDNISKEDKKLARKYNISDTKASYINKISKKYKDIPINKLINNSVKELSNSLENGYYCNEGYILDGEFCKKEIDRKEIHEGKICPNEYDESNGICYRRTEEYHTENLICPEGFEDLNEKECIRKYYSELTIKCNENAPQRIDNGKCIEEEAYADMVEICRITPETDLLLDHKCYGPKPLINGGCLDNDVIINGGCVDLNRYYEAEYMCPNGELYSQEFAMNSNYKCIRNKEVEPISKSCSDKDAKIIDNRCYKEEITRKVYETYCKEGTLIDKNRCLILDDTKDFIDGLICDYPDSELKDNVCIIYKKINAERS